MEMMAGQFKWNADRSCVCKEEEVAEKKRDNTLNLATRSMASSTCTNYEIDNKLDFYTPSTV